MAQEKPNRQEGQPNNELIPPNPYAGSEIPDNPYGSVQQAAGAQIARGEEAMQEIQGETQLTLPRDFDYWSAADALGIPHRGRYGEKVREQLQAAFRVAEDDFYAQNPGKELPPSAYNPNLYLTQEMRTVLARRHGVAPSASYTEIRVAQQRNPLPLNQAARNPYGDSHPNS